MTASILKGAHVVRVHDVKAAVDAAKITDEVLRSAPNQRESTRIEFA
jgi:dihydropteroate synthase